jgi:class 3 adenylate cyclase/tetratricopeptide (TPR) repeat protein
MSDIRDWLEDLGLGEYAEAFEAEKIGLEALPELEDTDLKEMGLPIGPRKLVLKAIRKLKSVPTPGTEAGPDFRPIDQAPKSVPLEAERRQVTVMFCDMVGSTALSERLDPEDLRTLMQAYQQAAGAVVERYEGHVAQYLGDGLMIYFGWPQAHEDDAERAVRAGLEIVEVVKAVEAAEPLQVRVGIATGPVVVGETGGGDASVPKMAVGETPNLAARVQGLAGHDQIVIAAGTHRLAGAAFECENLGEQTLKGIVEPVRCWRIVGLGRASTPSAEGNMPFVGREGELANLDKCLDEVERGRGQVVVLIGDPGVGKSRLLAEFRMRIGDRVAWAEGRCISFGQSMVFHPLIDLLRKVLDIDEDDSTEAIRDKVSKGVAQVADNLVPNAKYLHYMFGVAQDHDPVQQMDPQLRRAETFDALRQLLLVAAERKPQVLMFEDLHWSDAATTEFLRYILDSVPAGRLLLLATLRSGYAPPFDERSYVNRLALHNLAPEDTTRIAKTLLSATNLPCELQSLIHQKAEGNPFFVEELVKSLRETGGICRDGERWVLDRPLDQIVVPDTVNGVIMSRIDRLEDNARHTLQLAAVIGREFTQRLLDGIAGPSESSSAALRELLAFELIYQKALYPELAFMFKNALVQDVAYSSLLKTRRRDLHWQVATAIEEFYADRLEEHYAVIAHHFSTAQDWPKAADYFENAADHAAAAFAIHEAISLCNQAIDALNRSKQVGVELKTAGLHEKNAGFHYSVSDFDGAHAENEKAAALSRQLADPEREGLATAGMSLASAFAHKFERSLAESARAEEIARALHADDILAASHFATGFVHYLTGDLEEGQKRFQHVYELSQSVGDSFHQGMSIDCLGYIDNWQGNYNVSASRTKEALEIARFHNLPSLALQGLFSLSLPLIGMGLHDDAYPVLLEGLDLAKKLGDEFTHNRIYNTLGWLHAECGDMERAVELNETARHFSVVRGDPETIANAELNLGDVHLMKNDAKLAQEFFFGVSKVVGDPSTSDWMKWRYSQHLFVGFGETCLAMDDSSRADDFANQCLELATRTNSRKYLSRGWRLKGEIAMARTNWEDAEAALGKALAFAERTGNPTQLWKTHLALGRLYKETQRVDQGRNSTKAASVILDSIGQKLQNPELQAGFNESPQFRAIQDQCAID